MFVGMSLISFQWQLLANFFDSCPQVQHFHHSYVTTIQLFGIYHDGPGSVSFAERVLISLFMKFIQSPATHQREGMINCCASDYHITLILPFIVCVHHPYIESVPTYHTVIYTGHSSKLCNRCTRQQPHYKRVLIIM